MTMIKRGIIVKNRCMIIVYRFVIVLFMTHPAICIVNAHNLITILYVLY